MEEALTAALLASTALVAVVGQRITWGARRQGAGLPAIVLHGIDSIPTYADDGDAGIDGTLVQINCLASDSAGTAGQSTAISVARLVRTALSAVSMTQSGVTFQGVFPDTIDRDLQPEDVAGVTVYGRSLDYQFWHLV
jgi:hypothetical protein